MQKIIVSDTSCLILLNKLNKLYLLKQLFGNIVVTKDVADEFALVLPEFIEIKNPNNYIYKKILETDLDVGESSCIALALEYNDCLLILDDQKARKKARDLKLKFTGTLGLILLGKQNGYINSVAELIDQIRLSNFRISEKYLKYVLHKSGEK